MISISQHNGRVIYSKKSAWTISRTGVICSLIGALLVSSTLWPFLGFLFFAIGTLCWLKFAVSVNNGSLALLEVVYLSTNILGMIMYY